MYPKRKLSEELKAKFKLEVLPEGESLFEKYEFTSAFQREISTRNNQDTLLVASISIGKLAVASPRTIISSPDIGDHWRIGAYHEQRDGFIDMRYPHEYRVVEFSALYKEPELASHQWYLKDYIEDELKFHRRGSYNQKYLGVLEEQYQKAGLGYIGPL